MQRGPLGGQNSHEPAERTWVCHAASRGPRSPCALLRCLHVQVLPEKKGKKKAPKLCPSPAPLSSSGRVHGFLRRAFQMAPGGSSAKLHSLSKCCRSPVLPGRGKGDPRLLSAAAKLTSWGEQRAPHHLPRTLLESPVSSLHPLLLPQWACLLCKSAGSRQMLTEDREA